MSELDGPEIEMDRGFKIQQQRGWIWAAYAPQGSGSGYYSTEKKGHWYADKANSLRKPPPYFDGYFAK